MTAPYNTYKIIRSKLDSDYSYRLYEPYHDISRVFISNKTVSVGRKLRWSTTLASQHTRGAGRNSLLLSFFLSSSARLAR